MSKPSQYVGNSRWPFGAAEVQQIAFAAAITAEIWNTKTKLMLEQLTGNATLNLDIDEEVTPGDMLTVEWSTAGTQTLTFGDGIIAPTVAGVAGKNFSQAFEFNGTNFIPLAEAIQID